MSNLWNREPAVIVAAFSAVLSLAIGFGAAVTPVQFGLIMAAISAVLGVIVRSSVTPVASVVAQVDGAGVVVAGPASVQPLGAPVDVTALPQ